MTRKALAVGAGALLLLAGAAGAAPTWGPPAQLSPRDGGPAAFGPLVATNAAGDAVVVWDRAGNVQATGRRAGSGSWSPPVDLGSGSAADVGIDESGRAVATFTRLPGSAAQAAYRPGPTAAWEAPVTLSSRTPASAGEVAVNSAGDAVASVTSWSGTGYVTGASFRSVATGLWEPAVDLSDPAGNAPFGAAVALDEAGNAVAVWTRRGPVAERPVVQASRRPAGGTWEPAVDLAGPFLDVVGTETAFVAGGVVAVWIAVTGAPPNLVYTVQAAFRPTGGAWGPPSSISAPGGLTEELRLGADRAGNAIALWRRLQPGTAASLQSAARSASSGAWGAAVDVVPEAANRFLTFADLAVGPDGNAVAVWTDDSEIKLRAAIRPAASGGWQPPVDIAEGGGFRPRVALDGHGNALAVWPRSSTPPTVVDYSELRAGGPVITRLGVPPRATARVPTEVTVEAVPWGSPLAGAPTWSFGDGASASGTSVRHVYTAPGDYTVTVTLADAAGGTTTASAQVAVAAPTLANVTKPSIRGRPRVGATLVCSPGRWTGTPTIRFSFAWLRDRRPIARAAGSRYRARAADAGRAVACRVRASNPAGSAAATSRALRIRG